MGSRRQQPSDGLAYLAAPLQTAVGAERARVERDLGHTICGRYLGTLDERPNLCWRTPGHRGSHL